MIAKEMQIPWRAAENMHWQMGEIDIAQRANVPVFHLAGQQSSREGAMPDRVPSTPPLWSHTHNHSPPQVPSPNQVKVSPADSRCVEAEAPRQTGSFLREERTAPR